MYRIVTVRVGEQPKVEEIDDSLEAMQAIVGGHIEMVPVGGNIFLVCNEDGMALGLPQNGCGMLGSYFFTKADDEGETASLSPAECEAVMAQAVARRGVRHAGLGGFEVRSFDSAEEMLDHIKNRQFDSDHRN